MPYAPAPFSSQLGEAAPPSNHWAFPPRAMNHMPYRPPSGGPIPVAARGIFPALFPRNITPYSLYNYCLMSFFTQLEANIYLSLLEGGYREIGTSFW